jgi:hypothetical protein
MSVMNSSNFAKALWPGVNTWYGKAYDTYPSEWKKLYDMHTSRRAWEEDVGVSSFGLAQVKTEGAPITYDSERQGFTSRYTHVVYSLGFVVTREMFDDDLYDIVGQRRAKGLAFSMGQTKDVIGANVYNRAFNSSYLGGDGVALCVSNHANIAGGTWSNIPAVAVDLSEAALEQAKIDIAGFTNDRGLKIAVLPQTLIIPYQLEFEATRLLKTVYRVGSAANDISAIVENSTFPGGMQINHYLTDTDAWFIRTNVDNGLKYFERSPDSFDMDNDFDTENAKFKGRMRFSFGWTDPRQIYGSAGA